MSDFTARPVATTYLVLRNPADTVNDDVVSCALQPASRGQEIGARAESLAALHWPTGTRIEWFAVAAESEEVARSLRSGDCYGALTVGS